MKKYVVIYLLCVSSVAMLGMDVEQSSITERTKKRECVSRVIAKVYHNKKSGLSFSQPISIAGSDEFFYEGRQAGSVAELFKSSSSLSDQGCSPSFSDY